MNELKKLINEILGDNKFEIDVTEEQKKLLENNIIEKKDKDIKIESKKEDKKDEKFEEVTEGSVALTLISANVGAMTLVFDLSKAYGRVRKNNTIYWKELKYDPNNPNVWDTSSGKHLCSSHKMFCCCPDHLGGALANLEFPKDSAGMDAFPLPNASRSVIAEWEKQGTGILFLLQWISILDISSAFSGLTTTSGRKDKSSVSS